MKLIIKLCIKLRKQDNCIDDRTKGTLLTRCIYYYSTQALGPVAVLGGGGRGAMGQGPMLGDIFLPLEGAIRKISWFQVGHTNPARRYKDLSQVNA